MENSDSEFEKPQASSTQIKKKKPNEAALKSLLQDASKKTKSDFLTTMFQQASNSQLSSIMQKINARMKPVNAEPESPLRGILKLPKEEPQSTESSSESKNKKSKTIKLERQNSTSKGDQLSKVTPKKTSPKKQPVLKIKKEVSDSSSEEEPGHIKTQKFAEAQMKQKKQLVQKMQTEDTDSSSDEEEDLQKKTEKIAKAQLQKISSNKQPVKKLQKEDSSSDEEEGLEAQTEKIMHAQIKHVLQQQRRLAQTMQTEDTDSNSDEEEDIEKVTKTQVDKQPQKMGLNKKPLKKLEKEESDSSGDEDYQKMILTQIKNIHEKVMLPKAANNSDSSSEDSEESSDSDVSSGSENEQPKKQADAKPPLAISSNKVTKQKDSDSSDSESSSSDEGEKPVKTPQANSKINNSKGKQSVQSPKKGMGQSSISSGANGGVVKTPQKSSNTSGNNRQIKKSKLSTNIADEVESDFDMTGVANAEAQINLNNFAEMQRLKKAPSQLEIYQMITDKDEVYYLKVTKNLHPQLLTDSNITLDAPDKFTLGNKNYKSTTNKDLKQLTLLAQCGGKYSVKDVPLAGCLTINEDHQLEMLNNSYEIDDDVPITVPSEKVKERHPLFGIDYVERIELDQDIIAKLDDLINALGKKYNKKKKEKMEAGEKLKNEDILEILKSHVPNKKERRKSVKIERTDVNMEIDQSIENGKSGMNSSVGKKSKKSKSANMSSEKVEGDKSLEKSIKKTKKSNKSIEEENKVCSLSPGKKNTSRVKFENNSDFKQKDDSNIKMSEQNTNTNNSEQSLNKSKKKKRNSFIDTPDDKIIADKGDAIDENFHAEPLKKKKKQNKGIESNAIINSTLMSPSVGQPNFGLEESQISMVGTPKKMVKKEKPTMNLELLQQTIDEVAHPTKKKKKKRDHSLDVEELKKIRTS